MPHLRNRYAGSQLKKLGSLWPIVGVVGPRQVGKTTLLESKVRFASTCSLDDETVRADAEASAKSFLARLDHPALIDEVQKVPKLFDALKLAVHRKKMPGQYYLSGSVSFSEGAGIRESLTGRIGTCRLFPMTVGEALESPQPKGPPKMSFVDGQKPRIDVEQFSMAMARGGMPVPMFLRDENQRQGYWQGWLSTTLIRDLSRAFRKGFEPDFANDLLEQLGKILREGELPSLAHFRARSVRKTRRYLEAMETIFLVRKLPCHDLGVGKDSWLLADAGLATHLMGTSKGEGAAISMARHCLLNEISALFEYAGKSFFPRYYKSAKGSPVDLVVGQVPIRICPLSEPGRGPWGWHAKPVLGAMKSLESDTGILAAPVDTVRRQGKLWIVPWSIWS